MKKNVLLSILSGLLLWIAWPPTSYTTFLLFVAFVPMLVMMENIITSTTITRKGPKLFWIAFLGFFIWNTLCIYWVYNSLKGAGEVIAFFVSLIPYSLGPILMSLACWLYYRMRLITSRGKSLGGFIIFWMAYEYLHQVWDLNFPWMTLGNGMAVSHQWIQWYEYTGIYGGTLWILALNILLFLLYTGLKENTVKQQRVRLIAFVAVLAVPLGLSLGIYYNYTEQKNPSNVVVVQPNIDPYEKHGRIPDKTQLRILTQLSDSLAQANTEFFIWPETAIAGYMNEDHIRKDSLYLFVKQFIKKYKNGNVVTGAETLRLYDSRATPTAMPADTTGKLFWDNYNTALGIENSSNIQFYHKSKLVPGGEEIPFITVFGFLKPVFEHLGGSSGTYAGQPEAGVFYSQSGIGVDPVICYESIFGEYVGESVRKGAQFIAIITNDGWWENTSGKDQHLDYAKLRAIETRRWVCRSANTGISAFINQRGDVVQRTGWWVKTAIKHDINLNSDLTFYTRYGDYLPRTASLLAVGGIFWLIFNLRLRRRKVAGPGLK